MLKDILVPDIGAYSNVEVIEVLVAAGATISVDSSLITLETDKATLEVPSPYAGVIKNIALKVGDKVSEGSVILSLEMAGELKADTQTQAAQPEQKEAKPEVVVPVVDSKGRPSVGADLRVRPGEGLETAEGGPSVGADLRVRPHASPGLRRFARELGVELSRVSATGPKNRILKEDIKNYIKTELKRSHSAVAANISASGTGGFSVAAWPQVDFAQFGEIQREALSRIQKLSGAYLHRNWVMVPHVTQFEEADITELEKFRKSQQSLAEKNGLKLTPLVFMMKAVVRVLAEFPIFNASLEANGAELILKKYFHLGVAVDTPMGLVVPVVRDVDKKGLFELAAELAQISAKARAGQLSAQDMQGSSFTISSLGGIGGTAFTPIINVPDVAILGISKAQIKPVYQDEQFKPRLLLPLSLSYDHRVIDGAMAARFMSFLSTQLSDIRQLLL